MHMMRCEGVLHAFYLVCAVPALLYFIPMKKFTLKRMGLAVLFPDFTKNLGWNATFIANLREESYVI
jgi:hypothetical protein